MKVRGLFRGELRAVRVVAHRPTVTTAVSGVVQGIIRLDNFRSRLIWIVKDAMAAGGVKAGRIRG